MKAITVWQPCASLIARGVKWTETRSWSTKYRGPLAVAAAARKPDVEMLEDGLAGELYRLHGDDCVAQWYQIGEEDYVAPPPESERWVLALAPEFVPGPMPLGAVVATCQLVDCVPIRDHHTDPLERQVTVGHGTLCLDEPFCLYEDMTDQLPYGNFAPGRYAWLLGDIKPLADPVAVKGRQGLWEWQPR